jgi:hypothetical protein
VFSFGCSNKGLLSKVYPSFYCSSDFGFSAFDPSLSSFLYLSKLMFNSGGSQPAPSAVVSAALPESPSPSAAGALSGLSITGGDHAY